MSTINDRSDLEALFMPPKGEHGTHLLVCGLGGDTETLERMLTAFTNETPAQRRSRGLVRGLLLIDASNRPAQMQPVPGLLQLAPCLKKVWRSRTTLMHAKVALMGFGPSTLGAPRRWRLVVSTGNWTAETWGRQAQIDLFWTTEWDEQSDEASASQALADNHAAFVFFERLLHGLYGKHYDSLANDALVTGWLEVWRERLQVRGAASRPTPQFIHSLDQPLFKQVQTRFPSSGVSTLVAGSGFFEQSRESAADSLPTVLQKLETLGNPGTRLLVFNPERAGGLADWFAQLRTTKVGERGLKQSRAGKWGLCLPRDPLEKKLKVGRKFLHAKYIAGLDRVRGEDEASATLAFLYLGSGNLSRRGFLTRANLDGNASSSVSIGNVEAGVILSPKARVTHVWQRLACGDWASEVNLENAIEGQGEDMFEPLDPPPVLLLRQIGDLLYLVRSEVPPSALWLQASDGHWLTVESDQASVHWGAACPQSVRVTNIDPAAQPDGACWDVAVLSANGLLSRRAMPPLEMASILQALLAFPALAPHDHEDDDDGGGQTAAPSAAAHASSVRYALRTLAVLIETIAQRNVLTTPEEFPYWLAQLRALLLEHTVPAELAAIRALGVDLFDALDKPGFVPTWFASRPDLLDQYRIFLQDLRAAWCVSSKAEVLCS
ncbi:hypothetical protein [Burkholderia sp. Ac-20379]|uniref:hypothetical protein n=1 Tax=Burkholderia sp. Ac-20379 TaxID=2703900 RepID=UPI00197E585D|nr:hypothetical protein [Burkholderia sp. Ac-20379]MBN3722602.1 hypothetical protein [Burkholderia sp. Ac-20379]